MKTIAVRTAPAEIRCGSSTSTGRAHARNEDAVCCGPTWFAVADGMGGHCAGDVASRIAIGALRAHPAPHSIVDVGAAVAALNATIRAAARSDGATGMGTTLVAVAPIADGMAVVHVGDSRCYRLVDGTLTQLTHDHSHVQELVDLGRLTPEAARHHRLRNVVTRALGVDAEVQPDTSFVPGPVGRLLLCSDGLCNVLTPRAIGRVLAGIAEPVVAARRLVDLALDGDARDDVTALVLDHVGGIS